jgi:hypothetical protein
MQDSMWGYQVESGYQAGTDLTGFSVEASDGSIGKVDKHSDEVGDAYLVVDTGVWIFGKEVMFWSEREADVVAAVDPVLHETDD